MLSTSWHQKTKLPVSICDIGYIFKCTLFGSEEKYLLVLLLISRTQSKEVLVTSLLRDRSRNPGGGGGGTPYMVYIGYVLHSGPPFLHLSSVPRHICFLFLRNRQKKNLFPLRHRSTFYHIFVPRVVILSEIVPGIYHLEIAPKFHL